MFFEKVFKKLKKKLPVYFLAKNYKEKIQPKMLLKTIQNLANFDFYLKYIYTCLVSVSVCLFVFNKRQNGLTNQAKF